MYLVFAVFRRRGGGRHVGQRFSGFAEELCRSNSQRRFPDLQHADFDLNHIDLLLCSIEKFKRKWTCEKPADLLSGQYERAPRQLVQAGSNKFSIKTTQYKSLTIMMPAKYILKEQHSEPPIHLLRDPFIDLLFFVDSQTRRGVLLRHSTIEGLLKLRANSTCGHIVGFRLTGNESLFVKAGNFQSSESISQLLKQGLTVDARHRWLRRG
jgi:hypothetical protein